MSVVPKRKLSPQEYLAIERAAEFKSEFYDGEMFMMSGAKVPHIKVSGNLSRLLGNRFLKGPCEVFAHDLRVKVPRTGLYTYPDLIIVCEELELEDDQMDTLLNPGIIIEVLSESTEAYDRGTKFQHFQSIKTLKEYVLVSQDRMRIERYVRGKANHWMYSEFAENVKIFEFGSISVKLPMSEIYRKVKLPKSKFPVRIVKP